MREGKVRVAVIPCLLAALAACQSTAPREERARESHWGRSLAGAANPAQISCSVVVNEFPGVQSVSGLNRSSSEFTFAVSRATEQFDEIVSRIARDKGFDAVVEKAAVDPGRRLPDITYHVLREVIAAKEKNSQRIGLIDQIIAREEEAWVLLKAASENEQLARAARAQIQQLTQQAEQRQQSVLAEQAKVQQIEANLAAVTRDLQAKIQGLEASKAETSRNNESLTAELNKQKAEGAAKQARIQELEKSIAESKQQLAAAQKQLAETQALKAQLDDQVKQFASGKGQFEQQVAHLTQQVNELSGAKAALTEQAKQLHGEKEKLEKQLSAAGAAKGELEAQLAAERSKNSGLELAKAGLEKRVQELEVERQSRLSQLNKDAAELAVQVTSIQTELKQFTTAKPDDTQLAAVKNQITDLEVKVRVLSGELTRVSNLDKETHDRVKTLTDAITILKKQISTLAR